MQDGAWRSILGMLHADAGEGLAAVLEGLAQAGVPVRRALVAIRTLHPQIVGLGFVWELGRGVVLNEHAHGEFDLARYANSPLRVIFDGGGPLRYRLQGDAPLPFPVLEELRARGLTDYVVEILPFSDGQRNALTLATDAPDGFSDEHIALFAELAPLLSLALEVHETRRIARTLLDTYVGVRAGRKVIEGRIRRGDVELMDAVLLSCDLRGFTALSFDVGPEATVAALNAYFECVCAPIASGGGEILKFIGDGLLAAFPVDDAHGMDEACRVAVAAARTALTAVQLIDDLDLPRRHLPLRAGAALHVGQVAFGNVGARGRLDFTVIGPAVNLASRLSSMCAHLGCDILVSSTFARHIPDQGGLRSLGMHRVRGLPEPEEIFACS